MSTATQHRYLVIADISGHTSFVARTKLEHSHEIISELLGLLVDKSKPFMTLSKLAGSDINLIHRLTRNHVAEQTAERYEKGSRRFTETDRFEPLPDGGARIIILILLNLPLLRFAWKILVRRILIGIHHYDQILTGTARLAGEQYQSGRGEE